MKFSIYADSFNVYPQPPYLDISLNSDLVFVFVHDLAWPLRGQIFWPLSFSDLKISEI